MFYASLISIIIERFRAETRDPGLSYSYRLYGYVKNGHALKPTKKTMSRKINTLKSGAIIRPLHSSRNPHSRHFPNMNVIIAMRKNKAQKISQ